MAISKKFSPMRFTAASEEAAVEGALQLVGAARDEISFDVLSETAKGVTVRIRPRDEQNEAEGSEAEEIEAEAPFHIDSMHEELEDDEVDAQGTGADEVTDDDYEFIALDTQDAGEDLIEDDADEDDADEDDELDFDASLEIEDDEYDDEDDDEDDAEAELGDEVNDEVNDQEPARPIDPALQERALSLAGTFLEKLGLDAQVTPGEGGDAQAIPLIIEGEDVGILIGKYGATLQSFQYLLNLTLNNDRDLETEGVRVTVDAGNYRARRQSSLEAVAKGAAQRARREGNPVRLEPMPANERRIVHNFLQGEPGIYTQSEGREPHRCIVISPGRGGSPAGARGGNGARGMGGYNRGRGGRGRR